MQNNLGEGSKKVCKTIRLNLFHKKSPAKCVLHTEEASINEAISKFDDPRQLKIDWSVTPKNIDLQKLKSNTTCMFKTSEV